jgi:hypothetical protein
MFYHYSIFFVFDISSLFRNNINKKVVMLFISGVWIRTGGVTGFTGVHRCFIADSSTLPTGQLRELQKGRDKGKASHVELTVFLYISALQYVQLLELQTGGRKESLTCRTYLVFFLHLSAFQYFQLQEIPKGGRQGNLTCRTYLVFFLHLSAFQYFQLLELQKGGRKGNPTSRTYCFL